jgi:hypothetical protein
MLKTKMKLCIRNVLSLFPVQLRLYIASYIKNFVNVFDETLAIYQQMIIKDQIECSISTSNLGDDKRQSAAVCKRQCAIQPIIKLLHTLDVYVSSSHFQLIVKHKARSKPEIIKDYAWIEA